MTYLPGLALALAALWFALSGETSPLFLMLGAVSVLAALWLAARLRIIDRDASPYHRIVQLLVYLVWLLVADRQGEYRSDRQRSSARGTPSTRRWCRVRHQARRPISAGRCSPTPSR